MTKYLLITLGELALINYMVDHAMVGNKNVVTVAILLSNLPKIDLDPSTSNQSAKYQISEEQLDWIKLELAKNLENSTIPARFAIYCVALSRQEIQFEQDQQEEIDKESVAE